MMSGMDFDKPRRRQLTQPNIVPILDMMTTIIFFLLLSTGFVQYTKLTLPPSQVKVNERPEMPLPRNPRLLVTQQGTALQLQLVWAGTQPGQLVEKVEANEDPKLFRDEVQKAATKIAEQYATKFTGERTLQLSLGRALTYQVMISVMDGAREKFPDIMLISFMDAEVAGSKGRPL